MALTVAALIGIGDEVLGILEEYSGVKGQDEFGADRVLYGLMKGRYQHIARQHAVGAGRIDFRYGTTNPVVIELVLRNRNDNQTKLWGSQNLSELHKLSQVSAVNARGRYLLLLDRARAAIDPETLRRRYASVRTDRKPFGTNSVRIIYVHTDGDSSHFLWKVTGGAVTLRPRLDS
jgi:hypothetical protein